MLTSRRREPRRDRSGLRTLAARALETAATGECRLAEVYLKDARSIRCEIGPLAIRSIARGEERGIAIRMWDGQGREGFMHADAPEARNLDELTLRARDSARSHPGGPIPRLPCRAGSGSEAAGRSGNGVAARGGFINSTAAQGASGDGRGEGRGSRMDLGPSPIAGDAARRGDRGDDESVSRSGVSADSHPPSRAGTTRDPEDMDGLNEEAVRDLAGRLIAACTAPGGEATGLSHGWIETGRTQVMIFNSLGLKAATEASWVTAGITLGSSGVEMEEGRGVPALRYTVAAQRLSEIDPVRLVREAAWRAASAIGGSPVSGTNVLVALDPRSAAIWIRSLVPAFTRAVDGRIPARVLPALGSVRIVDDPRSGAGGYEPPLDGEGRTAGIRALVEDGVVSGQIVDSRDPEAVESELGPMRRDSFRDVPEPGPIHLSVTPGTGTRDEILRSMRAGLFVTSLEPLSGAGSEAFIAQVRGIWVEGGFARGAVARTILILPAAGSLLKIVERGADLERDPGGPPVTVPTLLLEGATLLAM